MKLSIYEALWAEPDAGLGLADKREFRRATKSILKGVALIQRAFENNPVLRQMAEERRLGFIVSSSVGEIEITRDFLKDFAVNQTARPFLFQLSSHNSTAGFLTQYFGLKGATLTLSNSYQGTEAAIESATLLLSSKACDAVMLFCVEQSIEEWVDLEMYKKHPQLKASSGANLLIVGQEDLLEGLSAKATLSELNYNEPSDGEALADTFYDSNVGEKIARLIDEKKSGQHFVLRPDSTLTSFVLDV
ncbi:MAG: beta-ketoacyl synthase chain length factor [Bdellovibrionota bacterium]